MSTFLTSYPSFANSCFNSSFNGSVAVTIASGSREGTNATFKVSIDFEPLSFDSEPELLEHPAKRANDDKPIANLDQKDFFIKKYPPKIRLYSLKLRFS